MNTQGEKPAPRALILMGVSGAGKTTVGRLVAQRLGWRFLDADDFHPPENVSKMAGGEPLDDDDRWPWLDLLRSQLDAILSSRQSAAVLACSALKESYRGRLGLDRSGIELIYLSGSRELLASRLSARSDHFMPADLLASQLETLEPPGTATLHLDVEASPEELAWKIESTFFVPRPVSG